MVAEHTWQLRQVLQFSLACMLYLTLLFIVNKSFARYKQSVDDRSCQLILTRHNDSTMNHVNKVATYAKALGCGTILLETGGPCPIHDLNLLSCATIPNVGREIGSILHYVINNYFHLPDILVHSPSNKKHKRDRRREHLLQSMNQMSFDCSHIYRYEDPHQNILSRALSYFLTRTVYRNQFLGSSVRGCAGLNLTECKVYHAWLDSNLCLPNLKRRACYNGIFRTTRRLLWKRPIAYYIQLYKSLGNRDTCPEIYAIERAAEYVFGGLGTEGCGILPNM